MIVNDIPRQFRPHVPHRGGYKPIKPRRKFITLRDTQGSTEVLRKDYTFPVIGLISYAVKTNQHGSLVYFRGEDGAYHLLQAFPSYLDLRETLGALKNKVLSLIAYTERRNQLGGAYA